MKFSEVIARIRYWRKADRIGPDVPYTHWRLYFHSTMRALCKKKFKYFADNAEVRPGAYASCCSNIELGNRVIIRPGTMLFAGYPEGPGKITIEDDVMLGSGVHIYVGNHRYDEKSKPIIDQGHYSAEPVTLKKGSWIGAKSIILPGVTIGENAVIGAGSGVTKSIPSYSLAGGNPAKVIRDIGGGCGATDAR